MRPVIIALAILFVAACSSPDPYAKYEASYLESCVAEGGANAKEACQCIFAELKDHYSPAEFKRIDSMELETDEIFEFIDVLTAANNKCG